MVDLWHLSWCLACYYRKCNHAGTFACDINLEDRGPVGRSIARAVNHNPKVFLPVLFFSVWRLKY